MVLFRCAAVLSLVAPTGLMSFLPVRELCLLQTESTSLFICVTYRAARREFAQGRVSVRLVYIHQQRLHKI